MKTIVPAYYKSFSCTASACRHNCCIGWEIGIDDRTAEKYRSPGFADSEELAAKLAGAVFYPTVRQRKAGERPRFIPTVTGRCPFLNESGLCELILQKGEGALCQICADHPRFRCCYGNRVELGLGLCCEAACRLILSENEPAGYQDLKTGKPEQPLYSGKTVPDACGVLSGDHTDWKKAAVFLQTLERMDENWSVFLEELENCPDGAFYRAGTAGRPESSIRRLREYLLYRHAEKDGTAFADFSWKLLLRIAGIRPERTAEEFSELCRLWSAETEYSDCNTERIISWLRSEKIRI